jgi:N-acetylmuramoyl-L-alanine amidase
MKTPIKSVYPTHTADIDTLNYKSASPVLRVSLFIIAVVSLIGLYFAWTMGNASNQPLVVIDPQYPTAILDGTEKINDTEIVKVNWEIAQKLSKTLNDQYGIKTILTREQMSAVMSPEERARVANRINARLFIRLDCNDRTENGFAVYYPEHIETMPDPSKRQQVLEASEALAKTMHEALKTGLDRLETDRGLQSESYLPSAANERSSYFSHIPVVTIEMGTLTYLFDALFVSSEMGQTRIVDALAKGVAKHLQQKATI